MHQWRQVRGREHGETIKKKERGFPGGAVVESPPANAGDTGSCPGLGRSHMPWSGWAREPWLLSLRVWSLCPTTGEATTVRSPRTAKKKKKEEGNEDQKNYMQVRVLNKALAV